MKIILARHGESEHNAKLTEDKDSILTERGRMHTAYLGKKLKKENISEVYASNLKRAKETAGIISKIIKVPVKYFFRELDEYSGKNLKFAIIGLFNLRLRKLKKILNKISKEREKDKTILIVAHGITNRIIIGHLLQMPLKKQLLSLWQHNTGLNVLSWNKDHKNWGLESLNDLSHLPKRLKDGLK
ncbi:histidine phosphatase family protein [Candidatus Pacearchaeota archaeon]|nr:histidine phosphatase family protein [Candidatus Pacearchaeota archaeon]